MPEKTKELQGMAQECRRLAVRATYGSIRDQLLEIAEQFDRMATERQRLLFRKSGGGDGLQKPTG